MSRAKTRDVLLVRLGAAPVQMKTADWQDTFADAIRTCATIGQSTENVSSRVADWVAQYLEWGPPTPDRDTACLQRDPYIDEQGRVHVALNKLAKYISTNSTEQITVRKLAAALRDNGWTPQTLNYYTDKAGDGKRSTVSYYRKDTA
jgi:hypothetical protein